MTTTPDLPPLLRQFSHRSAQDLRDLRDAVADLAIPQKAVAVILCIRSGLMRGPWSVRGGLKLARMKHGDVEGMTLYTATLARKAPDLVADLWKQTLAHMVSGKDAEDRTSAGGWNKRELDSFLNILQVVGWQRPILPEVEEEPAVAPGMR